MVCHMTALASAVILDVLIADPHVRWHPIRLIGDLIGILERKLHRREGHYALLSGTVLWSAVFLTVTAISAAIILAGYEKGLLIGTVAETIMTYFVLAAGSLRKESIKVQRDLETGNIEQARYDLSMIVGRDTKDLVEAGITRAAVETVAENTSDGVIAPLLYTALFGPAGGFAYKAVNTMDSMLGYRNEKYEYFGRCAAVADDVCNYIPSRLSALFMIAATFICGLFSKRYSPHDAYRIWRRDRRNHKSPNSAQTESVCAGALGVRLGGDSFYGGILVKKPYLGDDRRVVVPEDIKRSTVLMLGTEAVCTVVIYTVTGLISIFQ
ncbi:MAG: cobalamin biosynthesis protein CobD [Lachnospiraceae bacterium]|nr:cobalamin biosynthesis protein CobD [Lachnospiraceae bacterium]